MEITKELILRTKHLDPSRRSDFDEFIQGQVEATPVYVVPVASDPEALEKRFTELLTPPADLVVLEDSDVCQQSKLSSIHVSEVVDAYHEKVTDDLTNLPRLPQDLGELTEHVSKRVGHDFGPMLEALRKLQQRDRLEDRMIWFSYSAAENVEQSSVCWPVYAYVPQVEFEDVFYNSKIIKAAKRLARSRTIKTVTVIGKIPTRWYIKAL